MIFANVEGRKCIYFLKIFVKYETSLKPYFEAFLLTDRAFLFKWVHAPCILRLFIYVFTVESVTCGRVKFWTC